MKTVVVTDGKYRSSIAAARMLSQAGYAVVVVQSRVECHNPPPVFFSRCVSQSRFIEGSCRGEDYAEKLMALLREYDRPILLCVGADTLNCVSRRREEFAQVCDFLIAPPEVLSALNDKETVHARAEELGIPVPKQYDRKPDRYPVIIKPHCGEKFGLKASERYVIAASEAAYPAKLASMQVYDPHPIVQDCVQGDGIGVCLLLGREGELLSALCHRRIREYPTSGGPSTCCVSFYDKELIESAYRLLKSFRFTGLAMVEFKGSSLLEVNPRIWGSFPLTACTKSSFMRNYAAAAQGLPVEYRPKDFKTDVRMRFTLNDTVAILSYLKHFRFKKALGGIADIFRAKEALACKTDKAPFRHYLKYAILGK